jgi:DNA polymerase
VFGTGPRAAHMMLVGEQPGDQEDPAGKPFVGPAGRVLDKALNAAGIDRDPLYVTNAAKHSRAISNT